MREERQLLAHEGTVDAVLASDLGEQAAQLGGTLHRGLRGGGRHELTQALERDRGRGQAEGGAGALEQTGAVGLELAAADHLVLDVGQAGQHGLGVALADRGALGEDELEEMPGRVDLRVQMDEQFGLQDRAHDCISL